jgi:hypothetical protein
VGRFQDWRTGTRYPDEDVEPLARSHVEAALFALNGPNRPYRVRTALAEEKADVVAEWRSGTCSSRPGAAGWDADRSSGRSSSACVWTGRPTRYGSAPTCGKRPGPATLCVPKNTSVHFSRRADTRGLRR